MGLKMVPFMCPHGIVVTDVCGAEFFFPQCGSGVTSMQYLPGHVPVVHGEKEGCNFIYGAI